MALTTIAQIPILSSIQVNPNPGPATVTWQGYCWSFNISNMIMEYDQTNMCTKIEIKGCVPVTMQGVEDDGSLQVFTKEKL